MIQYSEEFADILQVVKSLDKNELFLICNGDFQDSPYVKYRKCLCINNEPASFIEVYQLPEEKYNFIVIATKKKFRRKQFAKILLDKMFLEYKNIENYKFMWRTDKKNISSYKLSIKFGFSIFNENANKFELIK